MPAANSATKGATSSAGHPEALRIALHPKQWVAFGSARPIEPQPRKLRAQYRCCAAWPERNCAIVIGVRTGAPAPR